MNAKHTPGPWTRNRAINTVDMGRYSVICPFGADSKKHVSEIDANMRIISAAPDLLAALEAIIKMIGPYAGQGRMDAEIAAARSAIAKAKGE